MNQSLNARRLTIAGALGLVVYALTGCAAASSPETTLDVQIVVRDDGENVSSEHRLACAGMNPLDSATLPDAARACALLDAQPQLLTSGLDPQAICTEIYGGPNTATISGTVGGKQVSSEFSRTNGCRIDQWSALSELLGNSA